MEVATWLAAALHSRVTLPDAQRMRPAAPCACYAYFPACFCQVRYKAPEAILHTRMHFRYKAFLLLCYLASSRQTTHNNNCCCEGYLHLVVHVLFFWRSSRFARCATLWGSLFARPASLRSQSGLRPPLRIATAEI